MNGKRRAKGTGYLIDNPDGSKTLRMPVKDPVSGKEKRLQVTAASETACNRLMRKRISEFEKDSVLFSANVKMTVAELCRSHLNTQYRQGLIKRTSKDRNDVTIRNQIENKPLGHMQVFSITSRDIDEHFTTLISDGNLSVSSIEKVKYILDAAFKWAVSRSEMRINPFDSIRARLSNTFGNLKNKGANDEDVKVLSDKEESLFIEKSKETKKDGHYKYPGGLHGRFLLATGLRIGEYIILRWEDYNFKDHILTVEKSSHQVKTGEDESAETNYVALEGGTKNSKARNIELRDDAVSIIEDIFALTPWKNPTDHIALTKTGSTYTATEMEHIVGTVYKNAGISDNVSGLHILRRTLATRLFREGYTVKEVAAYLGDEEATVSRYYIAARETREINGKRIAVVSLKRNGKK